MNEEQNTFNQLQEQNQQHIQQIQNGEQIGKQLQTEAQLEQKKRNISNFLFTIVIIAALLFILKLYTG